MARRREFTDSHVRVLNKPGLHADPRTVNLFVRVQPSGVKSFVTVARDPAGRQRWTTLGRWPHLSIDDARTASVEIVGRIKQGLPAKEAKPDTLAVVAENWLARVGKDQREIVEKERRIRKYLLPALGDHVLTEIKKSHVAAMLDKIETKHGARTADMVRTDLLAVARWHAERSDDYTVPFVGMKKRDKAGARERVLNPDELRAVWNAAGDSQFGAVVRLALYTAQRKDKVVSMRWSDIDLDTGTWTIQKSGHPKEKGTPDKLVLPPAALDLIKAQPRFASSEYIFPACRGTGYLNGLSQLRKTFDAKLRPMAGWTVHDLRRSARTYMAEADVPFHVAEKILGHKLAGVAGTYDRSKLAVQMTAALATLAAYIDRIVNPPAGNVVPIRSHGLSHLTTPHVCTK
jgi:integrase